MEAKIAVFKGQQIRKILHENEWWFSVIDICHALTGSLDPGAYWRKLKQRLQQEESEVVTFCHGLKLSAPDGKMRETDCANTEGIFRIIQSIPSPKAEPFKHRNEDSKGLGKLKSDAKAGGAIAGSARKQLEKRLGRSVISKKNFLPEGKAVRILRDKN